MRLHACRAGLLVVLALALTPASAAAHAALEAAGPAPGEQLAAAPAEVVLLFSEPLNPSLSRARLESVGGARVITVKRVVGRRLVLVVRARLGRGVYRVQWRSLSTTDAHPLTGSYSFGIGVPAAPGAALDAGPPGPGGLAQATVRGLMYAALVVFVGGLLAHALLDRHGRSWLTPSRLRSRQRQLGVDFDSIAARSRTVSVDAGLAALALAAVTSVVDALISAGRLSPVAVGEFLLTSRGGLSRLALVAFIGAGVILSRRRPGWAALAGAAALAAVVSSGHASSADPRALALLANYTHLLAGAVWLGGAATMLLVWWPALRSASMTTRLEVARVVLARFGSVAVPAFVVVAAAGLINALIELGRVGALWQTGYGIVLAVKIAVVGVIALAALLHSRIVRPRLLLRRHAHTDLDRRHQQANDRRHWALVRAEPALGLGVVLAAGVLVAFPLPPGQLDAAAGGAARVAACDPCPLPAAGPRELAVAEMAGSRVVATVLRRVQDGLAGTVHVLDFRGRAASTPIEVEGATTRSCGVGCVRFARPGSPRRLAVSVRERGRSHRVTLPARWRASDHDRARALLSRTERTMRRLRGFVEEETVTSGPGALATTTYRLRAPDRLAWDTGGGVSSVQIGKRQWLRLGGQPWRRRDDLTGGVSFSTRSWFRWTAHASSVTLVHVERRSDRERIVLALADPATPVWVRLSIDSDSGRVLRERLVAPARRVSHRFRDLDQPVSIQPPAP